MDAAAKAPPAYRVYVIELSPEVLGKKRVAEENAGRREDKPCVYVGQTARTPEERFAQHKAGTRSSRIVREFGIKLKPRLYRNVGPFVTRAEAEAAETRLAKKLRGRDYAVLEPLMQRCTFCRDEVGTIHWAFDGASEQPVPACRACCERLRLKVWKVDAEEPKDLPVLADCVYCGTPLPSADTRPAIVWVRGEHGVEAVCNACRIRYDRATQFVTLPDADWDETDWPQDN